jgi:SAM-dependent methyltransferase
MHQRFSVGAPAGRSLPTDAVTYGPDIPGEATLRLLGSIEGKRVLDLGCGAGHNAIALARAGAKVIAVDPSADQIGAAREACEREDVKIELHHAPLAELAFVRADTIDACISVYGLATVEDVDRVFRQVHRVLRPELPLVVALPHPAFAMVDPTEADLRIRRSYWESAAVTAVGDEWAPRADVPRTIAQLFTSLHRANFRIDTVAEPEPAGTGPRSPFWLDAMAKVPATLIVRARKQGI